MDRLVQTKESSIIYGSLKGEEQELFRCPRACDGTDLKRYIDQYRPLLGFDNDDTEDLRKVSGKMMIGYWRMYFRDGWAGRWMLEGDDKPTEVDCFGVNRIIDWLVQEFPDGCDYCMKSYFATNFNKWGDEERYLITPSHQDHYKVMIDTKYGNGDYPVRIYVYH